MRWNEYIQGLPLETYGFLLGKRFELEQLICRGQRNVSEGFAFLLQTDDLMIKLSDTWIEQ